MSNINLLIKIPIKLSINVLMSYLMLRGEENNHENISDS